MIILDTNVVSEPTKPLADDRVRIWLNSQSVETLFLTSTSLAELLLGVELLPVGRRRAVLDFVLHENISQLFGPRILPFDHRAAAAYATIVSKSRASGIAIAILDAQIAAVAIVHGFTVATRDTAPFIAAGVPVLNPWLEP